MKNIIVVDLQKGFINENNKHIVEKIESYLKTNNFDNIFFTKFINYKNSPFENFINCKGMSDVEEQEFAIKIKKSIIFTKKGYGLTTEMINTLKSKKITEIEIVGTDTDACIMAIAFNLFDNNIKPIILQDMCASSTSKKYHSYAIELIKNQFGNCK